MAYVEAPYRTRVSYFAHGLFRICIRDIKRRDLEAKLEQCLRLASQFPEGVTAQNLRELAAELQQKIRALGE